MITETVVFDASVALEERACHDISLSDLRADGCGMDMGTALYHDRLAPERQLFAAIARGDIAQVREILAVSPVLVHLSNACGETPLHRAAASGQPAIAALLLARGAKIDAVSHRGVTALHLAILNGHKATADLLANQGADVSQLKLSCS